MAERVPVRIIGVQQQFRKQHTGSLRPKILDDTYVQQYLVLKNDSPTFRSRASPCRPHRSLWGDQIKPPREAHNRVRGEKRPSAEQNIPGCVVNFVLVPLYGRSLALVIARSRDPNCTGAHQCGVRPLLPTAVIDIFPCSLLKPAANAL